jgi:hypothetical protein
MTRLNKLNTKASITKDQTHQLKEMGSTVLSILKKIVSVGQRQGLYKKGEKLIDVYTKLMKIKNGDEDSKLLEYVSNVLKDQDDKPDAETDKILAE